MNRLFASLAGVSVGVGALFGVLIQPVSAQNVQDQLEQRQQQAQERQAQFEENQQQREAAREERVETRCELATTRIDLWVTRYENNQSRNQRVYDRLNEIADQVVDRAQAAGKDTTEFETVLAEFLSLADTARAEYSQLITELENTQQYACGESEGDFVEAMRVTRAQLIETRQATLDARQYYQSTVRPAAQALLQS